MKIKTRTQPEEWACTRFCRIPVDSEESVQEFIRWLCGLSNKEDGWDEVIWVDPIEDTWHFDAPRHRIAKRLWQFLHGNVSDEEFQKRFFLFEPDLGSGFSALLTPVQKKLQWVMDGLYIREEQDLRIGQSDWGERWWLPKKETSFVRSQLELTHAELIEQSSDYEDAVSFGLSHFSQNTVKAIAIPSDDPNRVYVGERQGSEGSAFVYVQDAKGNKFPLKHGHQAYQEADGTGFEWGYGGGGPTALTRCILIDAIDGDLELAKKLEQFAGGLWKKFIGHHSQEEELRIPRIAILQWLEEIGKLSSYEDRRNLPADRVKKHADAIADKERLLVTIAETGELRSQRFDIVPETFEAALYLDLMQMLERGGTALRCASCGLPIPYDNSGRANRQRARSKKGQPIYHPDCSAHIARIRKKADWQRRANDPKFRAKERERAREYRKLS